MQGRKRLISIEAAAGAKGWNTEYHRGKTERIREQYIYKSRLGKLVVQGWGRLLSGEESNKREEEEAHSNRGGKEEKRALKTAGNSVLSTGAGLRSV